MTDGAPPRPPIPIPAMPFVDVLGHRLEYEWFGAPSDRRPVVMLHEGLGSVSLWKRFPDRLANVSGRRVLAYSRYGHGRSDRLLAPRRARYMHDEALEALPRLLDALSVEEPVLFGHSDGASIALILAGSGIRAVSGIVVLAPHVFVEPETLAAIRQAAVAFRETDLPDRLGRHHDDAGSTFWGWNRIWLADAFRDWTIEPYLKGVRCPTLVIQGREDEYGTQAQVDRIVHAVPGARALLLDDCRHSPQRDRPDEVLDAVRVFLEGCP